jgi:hypothetical protein
MFFLLFLFDDRKVSSNFCVLIFRRVNYSSLLTITSLSKNHNTVETVYLFSYFFAFKFRIYKNNYRSRKSYGSVSVTLFFLFIL